LEYTPGDIFNLGSSSPTMMALPAACFHWAGSAGEAL